MGGASPRRIAGGLNPDETQPEAAARRLGGRRPDAENEPGPLPFEATLAYVFRGSGGKVAAINAARLLTDRDERFKRLVYAWDKASDRDQKAIRLEDLCGAADLTPDDFLAGIIPALWQRNTDISRVIAAIAQPQIVEASIKVATEGGTFGAPDRKMLLEASGFIPTKQGQTINIDNSRKSVTVGDTTKELEGSGMPSFAADITEFAGVIRGKDDKLLLGPPSPRQIVAVPTPELEEIIVQPDQE